MSSQRTTINKRMEKRHRSQIMIMLAMMMVFITWAVNMATEGGGHIFSFGEGGGNGKPGKSPIKAAAATTTALPLPQIRPSDDDNPIYKWFMAHEKGRVAWKWLHYFRIYDELFNRFRFKEDVVVLEIGSRDGGSLLMWRDYFGPGAKVHSIEINPEAYIFNDDRTRVFIGSQNNRTFLKEVVKAIGKVDIVIDDASHSSTDQLVSFDELYPAIMKQESVYLIEDVVWDFQKSDQFNHYCGQQTLQAGPWKRLKNIGDLYACKVYRNIVAFENSAQKFVEEKMMKFSVKKGDITIKNCVFTSC
jgi:hypothetical protein